MADADHESTAWGEKATGTAAVAAHGAGGREATALSSRLRALQALNTKLICMHADPTSYQEIAYGVWKVIGCDMCALYLHEPRTETLTLKASVGYDLDVRDHELSLAECDRVHCQAFLEEYMVHVDDCREIPGPIFLSDEVGSNLVFPIISNRDTVGVFDFGSREARAFSPEDVDLCAMLVDQMAYSLENMRLLRELSDSRDAVIRGMALLAESRDKYIGGHLDRICAASRMLAGRLIGTPEGGDEVTVDFVETIARAAALHDIGKVGISDAVLLKPGKLTAAEFEIMKTHTSLGHELLNHLMDQHGAYCMIQMGAEVALAHHEKWDGSGYPHGRRGREIPLAARIVAVADVYDALTSKRIYKEAWNHQSAIDEIRAMAGVHLDPRLTDIFLADPEELLAIRSAYPD